MNPRFKMQLIRFAVVRRRKRLAEWFRKSALPSISDRSRRFGVLVAVLLICLASAAPASPAELVVSAAASLSNAFKEIGAEFERARSGTNVIFNFAASDILVKQIVEGAPVDLFASADQESMDKAAKENAIDQATRRNFVANRLVFAVPRDSRLSFASLADLRRKELKRIAVGQPATVPAGRYAKAALDQARLWDVLRDKFIYTQNVRQSLDYLARGEVDGGFVYATDAAIVKDKVKIAFDVSTPQPVLYPIAVTKQSKDAKLANEFLQLLGSEVGRRILQKYGFGNP